MLKFRQLNNFLFCNLVIDILRYKSFIKKIRLIQITVLYSYSVNNMILRVNAKSFVYIKTMLPLKMYYNKFIKDTMIENCRTLLFIRFLTIHLSYIDYHLIVIYKLQIYRQANYLTFILIVHYSLNFHQLAT